MLVDFAAPSARARQDLVLVQAALAGQEAAYTTLWQRYHKAVLNVVWKMVRDEVQAEDLTMEAFGKAFRHLPRYNPQFAFSTWLFRVATNQAVDYLRRRKLPVSSLDKALAGDEERYHPLVVATPDPDPQEAVEQQQRREAVRQAVAQLPNKYRLLVELLYFQERSYDEIAVELQLPLGTVKAQLFRARELLLPLLPSYVAQ